MLEKMKIKPTAMCVTCNVIDYLEHFFVACTELNNFWGKISNKILAATNIPTKLTTTNILFGVKNNELKQHTSSNIKYINHLILVGKLSISKFKYGNFKNIEFIFEQEWLLRNYKV